MTSSDKPPQFDPDPPGERPGPSGPPLPPASAGDGDGWSPEEIAERTRRALTAQGPPGKAPRREWESSRRSSQGTTGRGGHRRRYLVHSALREEEAPLEPPLPWGAFFSLLLGLMTGLLAGSLAPLGLAVGFVACALAAFALFQCRENRDARGSATAASGAMLAALFCFIHYSAYSQGRPGLRALESLGNRGTGNPIEYDLAQVDRDFANLDEALTLYYHDTERLPPEGSGHLGANGGVAPRSPAFGIPTFRTHVLAYDTFMGLTTPVAYVQRYPTDPFAPAFSATYGYYPREDNAFAILVSPGPDGVYQVDPAKDFIPGDRRSGNLLLSLCWDPTNGTRSAGDLWYVASMPVKPKTDPATGLPIKAGP